MNILFYRYGSICEPDVLETFGKFGFNVYEIKDEISDKNITPAQGIAILNKVLDKKNVDVIFTINFYPFISEVCNIYKIPYISWIVDSPVVELFSVSIKNPYNRIFLFDRETYNDLHDLNPDCIFHLPLAINVTAKDKVIKNANSYDLEKFKSDISFVGSLYTEKCEYNDFFTTDYELRGYLEGLMAAQLKVYGYYFVEECLSDDIVERFKKDFKDFYTYPAESYLTDKKTLSERYLGTKISSMERVNIMKLLSTKFDVNLFTGSDTKDIPNVHNKGFVKSLTEMPVVFANSKINLNITAKSIRSGISQRVFDILGCKGFMLSNYQSELFDYFVPGEDFDYYEDLNDLYNKCNYYLSHQDVAKEMANSAYEKICKHHTIEIRIAQMFETALKK